MSTAGDNDRKNKHMVVNIMHDCSFYFCETQFNNSPGGETDNINSELTLTTTKTETKSFLRDVLCYYLTTVKW